MLQETSLPKTGILPASLVSQLLCVCLDTDRHICLLHSKSAVCCKESRLQSQKDPVPILNLAATSYTTRKSLNYYIFRKRGWGEDSLLLVIKIIWNHVGKAPGRMPGTEYLFTLLAPENICSGDNQLCFPFKNRHAAAAKSLQSFPTLCDPMDGSPPGSSVHGIL